MAAGSTALYFNFLKGRDTASPHMRTISNNATSMASRIRLSSIVSVAATATMYAAFASLAAQAVALVSSMGPLVGLLAGLPGLFFAAVPGVAALLIGLSGLAAALKQTAGGAGQSAASIAAAEHRIELAQRSAAKAQQDLNDARQTAADRLAELSRELARAHLDEEGAVLAVADAERAVREARRHGNIADRQQADLNYREALQSLEEVRARLADVTKEEQKRQAAGVEGSDEVQTALQRQADATYELSQAQAAMNQSSGGGVDKAAQAYAKLSAEGRALVDVLRGLAPAWTDLRQSVQSSLLAGVADDVQALAAGWLPMLKTRLSEVATGWNIAFRQTAQLAATPGFIADMNDVLGNTATFWQKVGASFAPFFSGFRHFTVVGAQYLPRIGDWIQRIGKRFDAWAEAARRTGKANEWIEKGAEVAGHLWQILKNLGASVIAIFRAGSGGPDWLPSLVDGTAALRAWLESPAGQGKLAEVFATLRDIGSKMFDVLKELAPTILGLFSDGSARQAASDFADALGWVVHHLNDIKDWLPIIAAGYVAYRASLIGAVVIEGIRLPILLATAAANWRLASALRASTGATVGMAGAEAVAGIGIGALLGIIALFLVAIALMGVEIWYMVTHFDSAMKTLRALWDYNWESNVLMVKGAVDWIRRLWDDFINWLGGLGARIGSATWGMWDGIWQAFRHALNNVIYAWNSLEFRVPEFSVFGQVLWGGVSIGTPDIPYLARGGDVTRGGMAIVGENGPEPVFLGAGTRVLPNSALGGGQQEVLVRIDVTGADEDMKRLLRKIVRIEGGGNVQVALGR